MYDEEFEVIMKHYNICEEFIDQAIRDGGTVLVHW